MTAFPLPGCPALSPDKHSVGGLAAEWLSKWGGDTLELKGLKTLNEATAKILANWPGRALNLTGLYNVPASLRKLFSENAVFDSI